MRVLSRAALVLALTLLAGWAALNQGWALYARMTGAGDADGGGPGMSVGAGFRAPRVEVARSTVGDAQPRITAYGRLASRASTVLRPAVAGTVQSIAPQLTDGAQVTEGQLLIQLDPTSARATLQTAQAALSRARLLLTDSERQAEALRDTLALLEEVVTIRQAEFTRLSELLQRGSGLQSDLDNARLADITARQDLAASRTEMADLLALQDQQRLDIADAERAVTTARRDLRDLQIRAGISGTYHGDVPVPGEALGTSDQLGRITDLGRLEVRLDLTAQEIARVTAPGGGLMPLPVTLQSPGQDRSFDARLHHVSITVADDGSTTRQVVARVDAASCPCPLPGDFTVATIHEPKLEGVTLLPASALSLDGRALVPGPGNILEERQLRVLRALGNQVAVEAPEAPFTYVIARSAQLGAGLRIDPQGLAAPQAPQSAGSGKVGDADQDAGIGTGAEAGTQAGESGAARPAGIRPVRLQDDGPQIVLDPDRRAALIARVEGARTMPPRLRERALRLLQEDKVPRALVDRLEAAH